MDMSYVLVVDDDIDARALVMFALQDKDHMVVGAENGLQALNFICEPGRPKPYLILLDLNMPIMTGQQFLYVMKVCDNLSRIPIVVISGEATPPIGGHHFLSKPVDLKRLWELAAGYKTQDTS